MQNNVIILSGIPGSGKSTYARTLGGIAVSADDHFMVGGAYRFDPAQLGVAHQSCFRRFMDLALHAFHSARIVVDNTNMGEAEIAPYYLAGEAYGWQVEVRVIECPLEVALARQTHGVPENLVRSMYDRLQNRKLPPWWKVTTVPYAG